MKKRGRLRLFICSCDGKKPPDASGGVLGHLGVFIYRRAGCDRKWVSVYRYGLTKLSALKTTVLVGKAEKGGELSLAPARPQKSRKTPRLLWGFLGLTTANACDFFGVRKMGVF